MATFTINGERVDIDVHPNTPLRRQQPHRQRDPTRYAGGLR